MNAQFTQADEDFRREIVDWLAANLSDEFQVVVGRGGPGDEHALFEERHAWERRMGEHGWVGVGWPESVGGRGCSLTQQMIFHEEYARARGPGRVGHIGEGLLGPTLIHFGSGEQQARFLPKILSGDEVWCQGYSEPGAGSDLANVQTRAEREGDEWLVNGQKVWTSGAETSDWCFVLCRTDPTAEPKHRGISYLLVPMDQPGVEVRPIVQMTGDSEFSEVFFSDAVTAANNIVGAEGGGWSVAMGTLAFERGASTLGQQMLFQNELDEIIRIAKENGRSEDPLVRQRIAHAWMGLRIQRYHALRTLSGADDGVAPPPAASISKLFWATWHRDLGKLAMDVMGPEAEIARAEPYDLTALQRMFLFTRSDTIYGGSNQIQRNIISERVLGLPREPR
ncbi:MAG: acyl-CoA dehydrogenase family protein [Myxococcales bacterium]|nr:acyl-CoA dehydrogenase [Myxococcales bacterium]HIL80887.1 acyl-CoA dehydrogenase [Myxococcales bacterium]